MLVQLVASVGVSDAFRRRQASPTYVGTAIT
jgi:hypothetical protein